MSVSLAAPWMCFCCAMSGRQLLFCTVQVFLSHLHSDHHADLASLYVGAMFGRTEPWEVEPLS